MLTNAFNDAKDLKEYASQNPVSQKNGLLAFFSSVFW